MASTSQELLDAGKSFSDPLLVTRNKPTRLPPSSALSRAKLFLPQLEQANQDLEKLISAGKDKEVDIENVKEDEPVIEMNLMLYEEDSSSDDEDGVTAEDSDSDFPIGEVTEENIKLPNQKPGKKPLILEMDSGDTAAAKEQERTELASKLKTDPAPKPIALQKRRRKGKNTQRTSKKRSGNK